MIKRHQAISNPAELRAHLTDLLPLFQKDVSRYAPNRRRLWLFHEPNLSQIKSIKPAHFDERLWQLSQRVYPGCDTALVSYNGSGSDGRIQPHRDDTYSRDRAVSINLGAAIFAYHDDRKGTDPNGMTNYQLTDGGIYEFHCKHLHAVTAASDNRFSIVFWQLKSDSRYPWCKPCNPEVIKRKRGAVG